jgi:hypothetical protein
MAAPATISCTPGQLNTRSIPTSRDPTIAPEGPGMVEREIGDFAWKSRLAGSPSKRGEEWVNPAAAPPSPLALPFIRA